jgi:hypothetical protein
MSCRCIVEWRYSSMHPNLGMRWRLVVSFPPQLLCPWGKNPGSHWIGDWVGSRASLDVVADRKILPCQKLNLGHPVCSQLLYWLSCSSSLSMVAGLCRNLKCLRVKWKGLSHRIYFFQNLFLQFFLNIFQYKLYSFFLVWIYCSLLVFKMWKVHIYFIIRQFCCFTQFA